MTTTYCLSGECSCLNSMKRSIDWSLLKDTQLGSGPGPASGPGPGPVVLEGGPPSSLSSHWFMLLISHTLSSGEETQIIHLHINWNQPLHQVSCQNISCSSSDWLLSSLPDKDYVHLLHTVSEESVQMLHYSIIYLVIDWLFTGCNTAFTAFICTVLSLRVSPCVWHLLSLFFIHFWESSSHSPWWFDWLQTRWCHLVLCVGTKYSFQLLGSIQTLFHIKGP